MTDNTDRLAQIRARVEAATPGPWEMADMAELGARRYAVYAKGTYIFSNAWREHDTDFIAASREDVPYLLDLVDSLQGALADNFPATWDGFIAFLNRVYPEDVFTDTDKQPGSQMVWMARRLASLGEDLEESREWATDREAAVTAYANGQAKVSAQLAALRAVVEEALATVTASDETPEMIRLFVILDRGLKGSEG